jgi:hypothetical protein
MPHTLWRPTSSLPSSRPLTLQRRRWDWLSNEQTAESSSVALTFSSHLVHHAQAWQVAGDADRIEAQVTASYAKRLR